MGNRGGRIQATTQKLGKRRWTSKQWICCELEFNDRHRKVWGRSYSELFFLDEVTAFAAGHRPCFECRRKDAEISPHCFPEKASATRAGDGRGAARRASRRQSQAQHRCKIDRLPDGAMIALAAETLSPCAASGCCAGRREAMRGMPGRTASSRRAHAAVDRGGARGRLPAALASKFRIIHGGSIGASSARPARARPGEEHDRRHDSSIAATSATQAGHPPKVQARPPNAAPKLPPI